MKALLIVALLASCHNSSDCTATTSVDDSPLKKGDCMISQNDKDVPMKYIYVHKIIEVYQDKYLVEQWDARHGWYGSDDYGAWPKHMFENDVKTPCPN